MRAAKAKATTDKQAPRVATAAARPRSAATLPTARQRRLRLRTTQLYRRLVETVRDLSEMGQST